MGPVQIKDVVLGEGRTKVIVPITGRTADELVEQASTLAAHDLDLVEWRVDFFENALDTGAVLAVGARVVEALNGKPVLFTFRTKGEGGQQEIGPLQYVEINSALIESGLIDAVDVEQFYDAAAGDAVIGAAKANGVAVVGSNHDFFGTPPADVIVERLVAMQERGCDIAKMAVMPKDAGDVLTLLNNHGNK